MITTFCSSSVIIILIIAACKVGKTPRYNSSKVNILFTKISLELNEQDYVFIIPKPLKNFYTKNGNDKTSTHSV